MSLPTLSPQCVVLLKCDIFKKAAFHTLKLQHGLTMLERMKNHGKLNNHLGLVTNYLIHVGPMRISASG